MEKEKIIEINNLKYIIYEFRYILDYYNGKQVFFLLDENFNIKGSKRGEVFILIPCWLEMQDIYQSSSEYNIMTKDYDINEHLFVMNRVRRLCLKIVDEDGKSEIIGGDASWLHPTLGQFIEEKVEETVERFYSGSGLSKKEGDRLKYDCYKYFSAMQKNALGKRAIIPPVPSPILLMRICKIFNCTPDVARKISKKDIDMVMISREQEDLCQNPAALGFGTPRKKLGKSQ